MEILIGQQIEDKRVEEKRKLTNSTWEYYTTDNYQEAIKTAKDMGWKDKTIQLRVEVIDNKVYYKVEPFERDCSCPNIIKYSRVFGDD